MSRKTRTRQRIWILLGFIVVLILARHYEADTFTVEDEPVQTEQLFEQQQSGRQIEVHGQVQQLLDEDPAAPMRQRFILALESGHTLLITHNTELAPRIENLSVGDMVTVYGEYLWNAQGGLIHWTHHDPANRHPHGWIRHQGMLYQ